MCLSDRRSFLVPVLCALLGLGLIAPAAADGDAPPTAGAEVARLYEQAATATQRYEEGRKAADKQRATAQKLERLLARERRDMRTLRGDLGRIARAQYRSGGGIPYTAQLLLADSPEDLMNGQRAASQADLAVSNAISKTHRAERRLAADERRASTLRRELEQRTTELAALKSDIKSRLEDAAWRLESAAESSVTAGRCSGAVRMKQQEPASPRAWVLPVDTYELSAGFGGAGARWASSHTGQDFAVDIGTPVRSIGEGRVVAVSCGGAFGIEVVVRHKGGYYSQYAHLSSPAVDQGERVRAGQFVGQSGTTGNSSGPHLHFEVRLTPYLGSGVDPRQWLAERGLRI